MPETTKKTKKPLVLIISDLDKEGAYMKPIAGLGYEAVSLHSEWNNNPALKNRTMREDCTSHLNPDFIAELIRQKGAEYFAVVLDLGCDDLIPSIKKAGYGADKKIIVVGDRTPLTGNINRFVQEGIFYVEFTLFDFQEQLKETLERKLVYMPR